MKTIIEIPNKIECSIKIKKGFVFIEILLNEKKKFFLLDSGAPSIILNEKHITVKKTNQRDFIGVSGKGSSSKVIMSKFNWNGFIIKNMEVNVIDLSHLEAVFNEPFHGLIGYEQLSYFSFQINYKNKTINLWRGFDKNNHNIIGEIPFTIYNHLPIIKISIRDKTLKFGLDTGAGSNLLDIKYKSVLKNSFDSIGESILKGGDKNERNVIQVTLNDISINDVPYKKMKTVLTSIVHLTHSFGDIDGLLGYEFLKQKNMIISLVEKKIYLIKTSVSNTIRLFNSFE